MSDTMLIDAEFVGEQNANLEADLRADFDHLGMQLGRRGVDIDAIVKRVRAFHGAESLCETISTTSPFCRFVLSRTRRPLTLAPVQWCPRSV